MPRYSIAPAIARGSELQDSPCAACKVRELTVCSAVSRNELDRLAALVTPVDVEPQQTIFYEADPADHVFNVTAGAVRVSKLLPDGRRQVTGFLFPGDFIGLAHEADYIYTAEAITPGGLCRFRRADFDKALEQFPRMEKRLLGKASNELATAQDQMLLLGRKTAKEKIASFLLMLSRRAADRGQPGNPVELPMTRGDIADYLGLTVETVSRTFTSLRKDGYIELSNPQRVQLLRSDDLDELAGS